MDKWNWTVKGYFTPTPKLVEITQRTPKQEQWIYCYHCRKETTADKRTTFCLQENR